jgi:Family of unknown function (DUF6525)
MLQGNNMNVRLVRRARKADPCAIYDALPPPIRAALQEGPAQWNVPRTARFLNRAAESNFDRTRDVQYNHTPRFGASLSLVAAPQIFVRPPASWVLVIKGRQNLRSLFISRRLTPLRQGRDRSEGPLFHPAQYQARDRRDRSQPRSGCSVSPVGFRPHGGPET